MTQASDTVERDVVPLLLDQARERRFHPKTVAGDRGYDTRECVARHGQASDNPHVAQSTRRRSSAIHGRTTRHTGYALSQRVRKRVEEIFGWMKHVLSIAEGTVGGFRRTCYRGLDQTGLAGYLVATAYKLVRMANLLVPPTEPPATLST